MIETARRIPVYLVAGSRGSGRAALIGALLARRPAGNHWAILLAGTGMPWASPPDVTVRTIGGCVCCTARVVTRVALTRLIREERPQRILIECPGVAHLEAARTALADEGLAEAVVVRAALVAAEADEAVDQPAADVLVVNVSGATTAGTDDASGRVPLAELDLARLDACASAAGPA